MIDRIVGTVGNRSLMQKTNNEWTCRNEMHKTALYGKNEKKEKYIYIPSNLN